MPVFMDVHRNLAGLTPEALRKAHLKDVQVQEHYGVSYHKYWFNRETGTVFCLCEGPDAESCAAVHRASHGLAADDIIEVQPALVDAFLGDSRYTDVGEAVTEDGSPDGAFRTILYTEIANLTATAQRLGNREALRLIEAHDEIVRAALDRNGGREIRHTGEGMMACFCSAVSASRAAIEIQEASASADSDGPDLRPAIRIGLSAGEPVERHQNLFGVALNLARRTCQTAAPGEVMLTGAVRELSLGNGFRSESRGSFEFEDFDEPVGLFALAWRPVESPLQNPPVRPPLHQRLALLWSELRRRRVVRTTVAYGVALFVVLQVADLTFEPLGLPSWSYTFLLVLGILGLPFAAALAWSFDLASGGVRRAAPARIDPPDTR